MKPHAPLDRNGKPIQLGDLVRIVGVPDLSGMTPDGIAESLPVFQHLLGTYRRVRGFDAYGCAELCLVLHQRDGVRGRHTVWIEPWLLHVPQRRSRPAIKRNEPPATRPLP